jgi:spore maturation protein A
MSWIWTGILIISILSALLNGSSSELAAAILRGAQAGVDLCIAMAGSICLWSAFGSVMSDAGITGKLSRLFSPLLGRIFPSGKDDAALGEEICANFCANLLGLGNAATPMGIDAARRLRNPKQPEYATEGLCRLIVLNTASIQLIPTNVAAVRMSLGCATPFDILPAVWITSFSSAGLGLLAAFLLGRVWKT